MSTPRCCIRTSRSGGIGSGAVFVAVGLLFALGEKAAGGALVLLALLDPLVEQAADALRLGVDGGVALLVLAVRLGRGDERARDPEALDLARDLEQVLDCLDL